VNATNQSKHFNSELKKTILESVNKLRNIIHAGRKDIEDKTVHNMKLQTEVKEAKREVQAYRDARTTTPVSPCVEGTVKPETTIEEQRLPSDRKTKSYSDVVAGRENNRKFNITIRSK